LWRSHEDKISKYPTYEGSDVAIARPINLADTKYKICQTTKVSDGDTINVDCDGEKLKLRFCGIDAPEISHGKNAAQPFGEESKALMMKLTNDKQVIVRPIERDKYGRTVAEVEVKGDRKLSNGEYEVLFVNAEMVKAGMAYHYAQYSRNCFGRDRIIKAEEFAKDKKLGVWDGGNYEKPWDFRHANK
jgi:endonuclease YncB( thermonuclease family)